MYTIEQSTAASDLLFRILETLDISPTQYKLAVDRYKAVGSWLCVEGTLLAAFKPEVAPQGSFRIGTVIKPWDNADIFDIDLTVRLLLSSDQVSQWEVKRLLERRLRENENYNRMLDEEHRRCWRLLYAEATQFHMDLVPAVPELPFRLLNLGVAQRFCKDPMAITDNLREDYKLLNANWPKSNMKGFAEWFLERMAFSLDLAKQSYATRMQMSVEDVQFYQVKTPLQRVVQLLKRHRDIMFKGDEDAPISIIITTLAAHAYDQYDNKNLYEAALSIIAKMRTFIRRKLVNGEMIYWIENPVNPSENFADKWPKNDRKRELFFKWLDKVEVDFKLAFSKPGIPDIAKELKKFLGEDLVNRAINQQADNTLNARKSGALFVNPTTGILSRESGRKILNHTNYGA